MTEQLKPDVTSIIEYLQPAIADVDTFYNHVFDKTLSVYYNTVISQIAYDLLAMSVDRQHLGLHALDPKEDEQQLTQSVIELALLVANWFVKNVLTVAVDIKNAIAALSADDVKQSRYLHHQNLLN